MNPFIVTSTHMSLFSVFAQKTLKQLRALSLAPETGLLTYSSGWGPLWEEIQMCTSGCEHVMGWGVATDVPRSIVQEWELLGRSLGNGSNACYKSVVSVVLKIWVMWPGMPGGWAGAKLSVCLQDQCPAVASLKCLKMSDILPFQKACHVYTWSLLKSSLVDTWVVEQDRRNCCRPGTCLQSFSDAGDYVEVIK